MYKTTVEQEITTSTRINCQEATFLSFSVYIPI